MISPLFGVYKQSIILQTQFIIRIINDQSLVKNLLRSLKSYIQLFQKNPQLHSSKQSMRSNTENQIIDSETAQFFHKQDLFRQTTHKIQLNLFKQLLQERFNKGNKIYKLEDFDKIFPQVNLIKLPNLKIGILCLIMCFRGIMFVHVMKEFENKDNYKGKRAKNIQYLQTLLSKLSYNPVKNPIEDIRQNLKKILKQRQICNQAVFNHFSEDQAKQMLYTYIIKPQHNDQNHESLNKLVINLIDKQFKLKQTRRIVSKLKENQSNHQIGGQKRYLSIYLYPKDDSEGIHNSWLVCAQSAQPQIQSELKTEEWFKKQNFIPSKSTILSPTSQNKNVGKNILPLSPQQYKKIQSNIIPQQRRNIGVGKNSSSPQIQNRSDTKDHSNMIDSTSKIGSTSYSSTINRDPNQHDKQIQKKQPRKRQKDTIFQRLYKNTKKYTFQIILVVLIGAVLYHSFSNISQQFRQIINNLQP